MQPSRSHSDLCVCVCWERFWKHKHFSVADLGLRNQPGDKVMRLSCHWHLSVPLKFYTIWHIKKNFNNTAFNTLNSKTKRVKWELKWASFTNAQLIFKHMSPKDYVYHNKYYLFIISRAPLNKDSNYINTGTTCAVPSCLQINFPSSGIHLLVRTRLMKLKSLI